MRMYRQFPESIHLQCLFQRWHPEMDWFDGAERVHRLQIDVTILLETSAWTTPPDVSDEDSIAAVRIFHIGLFWNRDLVQRYAFPDFSDIFRCFARQEHDCSSAVHPLPHCIILLTHIQKVVTKEQGLQLQIYIVIGLLWLSIDKLLTAANFYICSQLL